MKARLMTAEEMAKFGWDGERPHQCLELADGTLIVASQDEEMNGPGHLMALTPSVAGGGAEGGLVLDVGGQQGWHPA